MEIYGLKTCDTCRKARKALPDAAFKDVREDGVAPHLLTAAFAQFGAHLLNTRSTTWRGLNDSEKARDPMDLLADHPTLMKRPLIVAGDHMYLGWDAATRGALGVS